MRLYSELTRRSRANNGRPAVNFWPRMMNFDRILATFGQNVTGNGWEKRVGRRPQRQACSARVDFLAGSACDSGDVSAGCVVNGNCFLNCGGVR